MSSVKTKEKLGPIELEVIHGTIRAAELEIEAAVERTARSPMIEINMIIGWLFRRQRPKTNWKVIFCNC